VPYPAPPAPSSRPWLRTSHEFSGSYQHN
jgi:hypothetical protein